MNKYKTTFGEYLTWYLFPPESETQTPEEIGKWLSNEVDHMGYSTVEDNIAAYMGFWDGGDNVNEARGRLYLPTKTSVIVFVIDHFNDNIVVEDLLDPFGHIHRFEVNGIKFNFDSITNPFNNEEFIIQ